MNEMIINVNTLPESLLHRFRSDKVRVRESGGKVVLTPVSDKKTTKLWGLLPDKRFTTTQFLAQKKQDRSTCGYG